MAHSTARKIGMPPGELKSAKLEIDWSAKTFLPIEFEGAEVSLEAHAYQGCEADIQAIALVHRTEAAAGAVPVVRLHSGCVTGDVFHSLRCDCHAQLKAALARITSEPLGVLIYLPYQEGRGIGLFRKIKAYALQDQGLDTVDANFAGEILKDLGFARVRLMTNNPDKIDALSTAGIEVLERIPLVVDPSPHNKAYLETKRKRLAHEL
jgi:GTP cyclohydrolase II/3,4-dihydroxy 2-butanone 4-phosphate synthase/GTP cyclohydrolase II